MKHASDPVDPLRSVKRIIIVHNPHSTNAQQAEEYIRSIQTFYKNTQIETIVVETISADITQNCKLLEATLQDPEHEALVVLGGDGTWRLICAALVDPLMSTSVRKVLLVKLPGGNADDSFRSLHARRWRSDPLGILQHPKAARRVITVHPLVCTYTTPNERQEYIGMGYITLGVTAYGAEALNDEQYRSHKQQLSKTFNLARDMAQTLPTMLSFPKRFTVQLQDNTVQEVAEMQFVNGPIMTEHGKYPVALSDEALHFGTIQSNHPSAVVLTALRMYLRVPPGSRTQKPVQFSILSKDTVPAQADGESFTIPGRSAVTISRSPLTLRILATKPA